MPALKNFDMERLLHLLASGNMVHAREISRLLSHEGREPNAKKSDPLLESLRALLASGIGAHRPGASPAN